MASSAELVALSAAIIATLGGDEAVAAALAFAWPAPTGDAAVLANVPHLLWQAASAMMLAEHAGKIEATATAFETLKAATPTPFEVETNQVTHGVLEATNVLGINTPAIVANRAQYFADYWLRSASNKYAYSAASAVGVQAIEPLPPPPSTTMPMSGGQGDPSSAAQAPMQMLMPMVSQIGQMGGQLGQLAGGGGGLSSVMQAPMQALQPLMSMSSLTGASSQAGTGALDGVNAVGGAASVSGPVTASLGAGGGGAGFSGIGGASAALAPLRGPVSWPSATVPVSTQTTAPPAALADASSAPTSPASMGGGSGAMMAPLAARSAADEDKRDDERSAAILGSIANYYRDPVTVPVITGDTGALIGGRR